MVVSMTAGGKASPMTGIFTPGVTRGKHALTAPEAKTRQMDRRRLAQPCAKWRQNGTD